MAATIMLRSFLVKFALELLMYATVFLLLVISGMVLVEIYNSQLIFNDFKRKSNGLFMAKDRSIICNHTVSWGIRKNMVRDIDNYYKEHGQKTYGWLMQNQFGATTFDPDLMKSVVLNDSDKNSRFKIDAPAAELVQDSIIVASGDRWRRLRRAVAPALRSSKFKAPNVLSEIETSISLLIESIENKLEASEEARKSGVTVEVDEMVHRFTLDLVFRCFYKQYDLIDFNAKHCKWTELVDEGLSAPMRDPIIKIALTVPSLCRPIDWLMMNFHRQGKWRREIINFVKTQTKLSLEARKQLGERKAQGEQVNEDNFVLRDGTRFQRNLIDHITDHLLDGKITRREYFNTSGFLINAADKTVCDALVHTLYRLAIDSTIQDKLRKSIEEAGTKSTYLDWVISESLRFMPPVPVGAARSIAVDMKIADDKILPAGTSVNFPSYTVHRLKEYWGEDAEEFRPERFAKSHEFHPMQYVPFGAGIRMCPGRELALFEMRELLSRLLPRYKFSCKPKDDAYQFDSPFLVYILHNSPTYIRITRV